MGILLFLIIFQNFSAAKKRGLKTLTVFFLDFLFWRCQLLKNYGRNITNFAFFVSLFFVYTIGYELNQDLE